MPKGLGTTATEGRIRKVIFLEKSTTLTQVMDEATNILFPLYLNNLSYTFPISVYISDKLSHSLSLKCFLFPDIISLSNFHDPKTPFVCVWVCVYVF